MVGSRERVVGCVVYRELAVPCGVKCVGVGGVVGCV